MEMLLTLLMLCFIFAVVLYIVRLLPWPAPFGQIAQVLVLLFFLLALLNGFGILGTPYWHLPHVSSR